MFFCEFYEIPRNTFFTEHFWGTAFKKYLLASIKRSKVHERNISRERAWNFDQWKTFSENYKAVRVWLWLVCKITKNNCRSRILAKFPQTIKNYPTFLNKLSILTCRLLVISSQKIFLWTTLLENLCLAKYLLSASEFNNFELKLT